MTWPNGPLSEENGRDLLVAYHYVKWRERLASRPPPRRSWWARFLAWVAWFIRYG
jgi:hypothetical protein